MQCIFLINQAGPDSFVYVALSWREEKFMRCLHTDIKTAYERKQHKESPDAF